jgi:perosamine synthetase
MRHIPHSSPWIDDDDIEAVLNTIKSSYVGPSNSLEDEISTQIKKFIQKDKFKIVSSGTMAIYTILKFIKNKYSRKEVVISSINCWSVYNSIIQNDLRPVVCDVRSRFDFRSNFENFEKSITSETVAIIVTHMYGNLIEQSVIKKIKKKFPALIIIEDYASSFGALYSNKGKVGLFSDYVVASFASTKAVTGGIGGVVASNQSFIGDSHIFKNDDRISLNISLSSLDQALLLSQLKKVDLILKRKQKVFDFYKRFSEFYEGEENNGMYRAITFDCVKKIEKNLKQYDLTLDIRHSVQPNISRELELPNSNSNEFRQYYSLPLNKDIYESLLNNGEIW